MRVGYDWEKNSRGAASAREGAICITRRKCLEGTQRREGNDQESASGRRDCRRVLASRCLPSWGTEHSTKA